MDLMFDNRSATHFHYDLRK